MMSPPGDESAGVSAPVVSPPGDESAGNRGTYVFCFLDFVAPWILLQQHRIRPNGKEWNGFDSFN